MKNANNAIIAVSISHQALGGSALSGSLRWTRYRLVAQTHAASIVPAITSVGQCAPRYTRERAIAIAGRLATSNQVRRMRGGCPRPARTARVRNSANEPDAWPLGML